MAATDEELDKMIAATPPAGGKHSDEDLDALIASTPAKTHVGAGETFINNAIQSPTFGAAPKIVGAGASGVLSLIQAHPGLAKLFGVDMDARTAALLNPDYEAQKERFKERTAEGSKENPEAALAGQVGGMGLALAAPIPGVKVGADRLSMLGKYAPAAAKVASGALTGAGYGALAGAGNSEADTAGGLASDALKGAGLGATVGGAGGALAAGAEKVAQYAGGKVAAGLQKAQGIASKNIEKQGASLQGALGAETQSGNRLVENLRRLEEGGNLSPETSSAISKLKASPEWAALEEKLAKSGLESFPGKASAIEAKQAALSDFAAGKEKALADEAARVAGPEEAMRQVGERLRRYGPVWAGGLAAKALGSAEGPGDRKSVV